MRYSLLAASAVAALGFAPHANAGAVPDAAYDGYGTYAVYSPFSTNNFGVAAGPTLPAPQNLSGLGYSTTESSSPDPTLVAAAATTPTGVYDVTANTGMRYYFEITGPSAAEIPVSVTGTEVITGAAPDNAGLYPPSGASGSVTLEVAAEYVGSTSIANTTWSCAVGVGGSGASCDSGGAFDFTGDALANTLYYVDMSANVSAEYGGSASASIDPSITIDPSFAGQYSIVLSDGVGDPEPSAVPEPASLALLATSLFGLGLIRRRA